VRRLQIQTIQGSDPVGRLPHRQKELTYFVVSLRAGPAGQEELRGFQRSLMMLAASNIHSSGPRLSEFELHELTNTLEIALIVSDENASRLAA
jgi:hypothetical protein